MIEDWKSVNGLSNFTWVCYRVVFPMAPHAEVDDLWTVPAILLYKSRLLSYEATWRRFEWLQWLLKTWAHLLCSGFGTSVLDQLRLIGTQKFSAWENSLNYRKSMQEVLNLGRKYWFIYFAQETVTKTRTWFPQTKVTFILAFKVFL